MKIVTFTEARNKLKTVLDQVVDDADYTIITRRDADDAVVMSLDYFRGCHRSCGCISIKNEFFPVSRSHFRDF